MKIIVVGGGAAGMMAAIAAAENGAEVSLLEQNEKLGKKLFITGKGRCNVTNNCPKDDLMKNIVRNPRFLYSAFDAFDNADIQTMIEEEGCSLKVERGDRVFPVSDHSSDIIRALTTRLRRCGVRIELNTRAANLIIDDPTSSETDGPKPDRIGMTSACTDAKRICRGIILADGRKLYCDRVILATGGFSYQTTGSDGKILKLMANNGHTLKSLRPALVPLNCSDEWIKNLQGLALKNVEFTLLDGKKKKYSGFGEMLFTHFGISGPIVLSASSYYEEGYRGLIDLKPALDIDKLDERLLRDFGENSNKNFENAIDALLPKRLIPVLIGLSGIDPYKKVHQITGAERRNFAELLKNLPVNITGTRGFEEAIITRGGINVKEVDPSTMKSKMVEGLFFAGEMLDLDALTGGFNLQIAWSTGYLAGSRAAWE